MLLHLFNRELHIPLIKQSSTTSIIVILTDAMFSATSPLNIYQIKGINRGVASILIEIWLLVFLLSLSFFYVFVVFALILWGLFLGSYL